jgi:tetratricopeptide (TPR) repeat protein
VSSRGRVFALVALAAAVASGVVVVGVLATRDHVPGSPKPRAGRPPLALDFGIRTDPEARALEQAQTLYKDGKVQRAAAIFAGYHSVEAEVGAAMADWPDDTIGRLEELQAEHPRSSLVALHAGLALYWARRGADAQVAWRAAARLQPDTPYAVRAGDFLHPQFAPGLPGFVPSFEERLRIRILPPQRKFAALRAAAADGGAHAKILYGSALQQLGRPVSAEREFAAAARLAPGDPDARAAAAVGLFDKANPARAFGRLGPLTQVFPKAQTVRFHLGLLLVWSAQVREARKQLQLAENQDPQSLLGRQAASYLKALRAVGTR